PGSPRGRRSGTRGAWILARDVGEGRPQADLCIGWGSENQIRDQAAGDHERQRNRVVSETRCHRACSFSPGFGVEKCLRSQSTSCAKLEIAQKKWRQTILNEERAIAVDTRKDYSERLFSSPLRRSERNA